MNPTAEQSTVRSVRSVRPVRSVRSVLRGLNTVSYLLNGISSSAVLDVVSLKKKVNFERSTELFLVGMKAY